MPAYDATHFNPPAPLARVTLRNPSTGAIASDVELLVDSGADVTLLPRQTVEGLGISLAAGRGYEIAAFDGSKSFVPAVSRIGTRFNTESTTTTCLVGSTRP
jgi:hypothetical protein